MRAVLLRAVGLDPAVVKQMQGQGEGALAGFAVMVLTGIAMQAAAVWLGMTVVLGRWAALLGAGLIALLLWSVVRLQLAGGGIAPRLWSPGTVGFQTLTTRWRPSPWPAAIAFFLAAVLVQPLLIQLLPTTVVEVFASDHRAAAMRDNWVQGIASIAGTPAVAGAEVERLEAAQAGLASQIHAAWAEPGKAAACTLALAALATLGLIARTLFPGAHRQYEVQRCAVTHGKITRHYRLGQERIAMELTRWAPNNAHSEGDSPFSDPPFNTRWREIGAVTQGGAVQEWVEALPKVEWD